MNVLNRNINNIFFIFVLSHLVIWTLVPSLTNKNLPLDTIEALAWGSNLDWGFSKHPPMSAFLSEFFFILFGAQDWAYYLLSQISVLIAFFFASVNSSFCPISAIKAKIECIAFPGVFHKDDDFKICKKYLKRMSSYRKFTENRDWLHKITSFQYKIKCGAALKGPYSWMR